MQTHRMRSGRVGAALVAAITVTSCGETETTVDHMERHFDEVEAVKAAVIAGDLTVAQQQAEWLAGHEAVAGLPGDWEPHVAQLQAAARDVVEAPDIAAAAAATGEMALACGACHTAVGEITTFAFLAQPEEAGVTGHMMRHGWAMDRMWKGLIGPSNEAWMEGVRGFAESPLQGGTDETRGLGRQTHELAAQGGDAADPAARAAIYSEMLTTCAGCHTAAGQGPAPTTRTAGTR
jgi:cytochrome c553